MARRFTAGAYPTHVFLSVECADRLSLAQVAHVLRRERARHAESADWTTLDLRSSLHISLCRSAPVDVQYCATLEAELRSLARTLWTAGGGESDDELLTVSACASKYLMSADGDRAFLTLLIDQDSAGGRSVRQWIAGVDRVFAQFGLAPYHENPLPHVSIAVTNSAPADDDDDDDEDAEETGDGGRPLANAVSFRVVALTIVSGAQTVQVSPNEQR
jgi:hypothetical protein